MKPLLQLKLGQHLTMTPQLQQAIRLLQLSTMELQTEIQQALEENPMLELDEDSGKDSQQASSDVSAPAEKDRNGDDPHLDIQNNAELPEDLPVDTGWDDIYDMSSTSFNNTPHSGTDSYHDYLENQGDSEEDLYDHLLWQLRNASISKTDYMIALTIIDAIDEDGYLRESVEDIHATLTDELEIDVDEVEAVLNRVQHFDPVGVGARDLRECLLLQLDQFDDSTPGVDDARMLISEHLELLGSHDYARLQRKTRRSEAELHALITFIQSLNPKPGAHISRNTAQYIVPDIYVRKEKGRWKVELNPEAMPKLKINQIYADHLKSSGRGKDTSYLRNSLQEARWFLKSLQGRSETLMRVGTAIVERQRLFLEYGEEGMKPLVLRDIAEELDMHESTISRVTTQKYMHTPRGVFEFKYFFSSHVSTADGGECSATAIRAMVRKLIENENPKKPISDNKIAGFLIQEGINVARRTVAKYRESMSIPPSNERKRLT